MTTWLSEFKNIIIACIIAFILGSFAGWRVESWRSNAALYKSQVESLQKQLKARDMAAQGDADQIAKDREQIDALKRKAEDAEKQTGPGECLSPTDTDRLRDLWK